MIGMNIQNGSMERDAYRLTINWQFTGTRSIVYSSPSYPARITENSHRAPFLSDVIASLWSQTILPILSCASSEVTYKTAENNINTPSFPKKKPSWWWKRDCWVFPIWASQFKFIAFTLDKSNSKCVSDFALKKTLVWRIIVLLIVDNSKLLQMMYLLTA